MGCNYDSHIYIPASQCKNKEEPKAGELLVLKFSAVIFVSLSLLCVCCVVSVGCSCGSFTVYSCTSARVRQASFSATRLRVLFRWGMKTKISITVNASSCRFFLQYFIYHIYSKLPKFFFREISFLLSLPERFVS